MKNVMKIANVAAFTILLVGGLNYLIAGLFGCDVIALMFGCEISVIGRIVYSVIGLSALLLLGTIIARVIMKNQAAKTPAKSKTTKSANS